ncbi:MAG: hypothetical protein HYU66_22600 [Armatimonadetes bacterium]|nr:hypothetical protein [Armatimonadota bacterium]
MDTSVTITLDEDILRGAERLAAEADTTLDQLLRDMLCMYVGGERAVRRYLALMTRLRDVRAGGPFTREEMNERG